MRRKIFIYACAALVGIAPAAAGTKSELAKTKKEIAAAKEHKEQLAEQSKKLTSELSEIQERLVKAADAVQKGEAELSQVEDKLKVLSDQYATKKEALERRKKNLASLVQAALHLSQTPPEAIVLMPGDSEKTMKAATALKMATASIKVEAESIRLQVAELEKLQAKVGAQHERLIERQQALKKVKAGLAADLAERKALQDKLNQEEQQEAEKIARLAKQAENLEGLVSTLQSALKKPGEKGSVEMPAEAPKGRKGKVRSFASAKGKIRPPLSGRILQSYGSAQGRNETSKGLLIQARPGAAVTATYDGEVVYAGSFLNYGKMVIIRHSDDFHTLLAGLATLDVGPGEFLLEGEPIGAMGEKDSDARLYIELRKDNQPVDPAPWITMKRD